MSWQLQLDPSFFIVARSLLLPPFFWMTALTDYSKTSFRPSRVSALHSIYLHFNSFSITDLAVSLVIGADLGSLAALVADSLRSILFPTKIFIAEGTTFSISGYHWIIQTLPFFLHWWRTMAQWQKTQSKRHQFQDRPEASSDRTIPVLRYPYIISMLTIARGWQSYCRF